MKAENCFTITKIVYFMGLPLYNRELSWNQLVFEGQTCNDLWSPPLISHSFYPRRDIYQWTQKNSLEPIIKPSHSRALKFLSIFKGIIRFPKWKAYSASENRKPSKHILVKRYRKLFLFKTCLKMFRFQSIHILAVTVLCNLYNICL